MFSRSLLATLALVLVGCVGTKHLSPSEVSSFEVSFYQSGMLAGCTSAPRKRNDEAGVARCNCIVEALKGSVSQSEWQHATFYAQQRKDREEQSVLVPHLKSAYAKCDTPKG